MPIRVPQVETAATRWVGSAGISRTISARCRGNAPAIVGLAYWLSHKAPGSVRASSATRRTRVCR